MNEEKQRQNNERMKSTRMAYGVHTFAGGFALGMDQFLHVAAQFEKSGSALTGPRASEHRQAINDARRNNLWPVLEENDVTFIPHLFNWFEMKRWDYLDQPCVVFGNPPCAPWSTMNTNNRDWKLDRRLELVNDIFKVAKRLNADIIAIESVMQSYTKGLPFWEDKMEDLVDQGFHFYLWLHNVNALGGFQDRNRFMFIASKVKLDFPDVLPKDKRPVLKDYYHKFEELSGGISYRPRKATAEWDQFLLLAKPGPLRAQVNGHSIPMPPFTARKLSMDKAVPTIVGRYVVHPLEGRCLNWDEFRFLLGFPDDWETTREQVKVGDLVAGILPMTRGVCPLVGAWLGEIIARATEPVDHNEPVLTIIDQR